MKISEWVGEQRAMMPGKNLDVIPAKIKSWKLRYAVVKPERVFNWLGMMNVTSWVFFPELRATWWDENTVATRQQIQDLYIKFFDEATGHFTKLEESMLKDGFHAPVNTLTGLPRDMYMQNTFPLKSIPQGADPNDALTTHTFGGSRTIIAQKLGIDIPCFIYDFTGAFRDAEPLTTQADVQQKFPASYRVTNPNSFPVVRAIDHTHMKGQNDGNERQTRLKVIEQIRTKLTAAGKLE